jgi:hypothetical protein
MAGSRNIDELDNGSLLSPHSARVVVRDTRRDKTIKDAADHHDPHVWGRQRCWRNFRIRSCEIVKVYKDHGISVIDCYSVA